LITAVEGGVGKPGAGVGVGVGALPLTVRLKGDLKTAPIESHAWTTTLCVPADMVTEVFRLLAETK
jgi:hypothetical protein